MAGSGFPEGEKTNPGQDSHTERRGQSEPEESRLAIEKYPHPALTHFWARTCHRGPTPDHLTTGNSSGPGPPRRPKPITRSVGSSHRGQVEHRGAAAPPHPGPFCRTCAPRRAAGGGRSVNTALVDLLAGNAHPSAAWRLQLRSPPTPFPHPAAPASPTAAPHPWAHYALPRGPRADSRPGPGRTPFRDAGRCLRPLRSNPSSWRDGRRARRGRECGSRTWNAPPAPGARPHPRGESSRVLPAAPQPPRAPAWAPLGSRHTPSPPAVRDWAPDEGWPHFSHTHLGWGGRFGSAAGRAPWLPSAGRRRYPGASPPRPAPPLAALGPVAASQESGLRSRGRRGPHYTAALSIGRVSMASF